MNLLEAILAGKIEGGPGGEVTPGSVVDATANMTSEQKSDTKSNLGVVDCTAENVVTATSDMTTRQKSDTKSNLGVVDATAENVVSATADMDAEQSAQVRQNIGAQAAETVTTVSGATPTITPEANTIYICGELTSLTISNPPVSGMYVIIFNSGSTPTTTTIPATVKGLESFTAAANTRYEINVWDNYALIAGWMVSAS